MARQVDPDDVMVAGHVGTTGLQELPEAPEPWMSNTGGASRGPSGPPPEAR
jgi:hypothetical protein